MNDDLQLAINYLESGIGYLETALSRLNQAKLDRDQATHASPVPINDGVIPSPAPGNVVPIDAGRPVWPKGSDPC